MMHTMPSSRERHTQAPPTRRQRRLGFWATRVLRGLLTLLLFLATIGTMYQAVATTIDQRTLSQQNTK